MWKTGRLSAGRQQRLAALGFQPDAFQDAWLARFRQLAAFHSAHGHCRVPCSGPASRQHPGLHAWLHHQLHLWRHGTLPDERRRRLEGLGVEWGWYEATWDARFRELLDFRRVGAPLRKAGRGIQGAGQGLGTRGKEGRTCWQGAASSGSCHPQGCPAPHSARALLRHVAAGAPGHAVVSSHDLPGGLLPMHMPTTGPAFAAGVWACPGPRRLAREPRPGAMGAGAATAVAGQAGHTADAWAGEPPAELRVGAGGGAPAPALWGAGLHACLKAVSSF